MSQPKSNIKYTVSINECCKYVLIGSDGSTQIFDSLSDYCGQFQFTSEGSQSYIDSDCILNSNLHELINAQCTCAAKLAGTVSIDGDVNVDAAKFAAVPLEMCNKITKENCTIIWCYDEKADLVFYTDPITGSTYDQIEFNETFEKPSGRTELKNEIWYELDDVKYANPICVLPIRDGKGNLDYFLEADVLNEDYSKPLSIKNYNMSNVVGQPNELEVKGVEKLDFTYCPAGGIDGTLQDVLDAAIAAGALAPDAAAAMVAPDAIAGYDFKAKYAKQVLGDKITTATGFYLGDTTNAYINGGGTCQDPKPLDADCDGAADAELSVALLLDRPFGVVDGAAVQVCLWFYVADADSADPAVQ